MSAAWRPLERVRWAANAQSTTIEYVRVDHRGAQIPVAQEFLDRPNVRAGFEMMSSERVTEGVARRPFRDTCREHGILECALDRTFMKMMPATNPRGVSSESAVALNVAVGSNTLTGSFDPLRYCGRCRNAA